MVFQEQLLAKAQKSGQNAMKPLLVYRGEIGPGRGFHSTDIGPRVDEWDVFPREAVAVSMKAQEQGLARLTMTRQELHNQASATIRRARETAHLLMREGVIAPVPEE